MKIIRICIPVLSCLVILAGCGKDAEESIESAGAAYAAFLSGDISPPYSAIRQMGEWRSL